jgi:anthranilate phosphoribosyltransferase
VKGGDCFENAATLDKLLNDELEENNPILDFVLLNAAALLVVSGIALDFKDGVSRARYSIKTGKAKSVLEAFKQETLNSK